MTDLAPADLDISCHQLPASIAGEHSGYLFSILEECLPVSFLLKLSNPL